MDAPVKLRAGPLTMTFAGGGLRDIRAGDAEVVSQIYAAVRDENWGTVPGRLTEVLTDIRADSFEVSFASEHQQGEVDFVWRGRIVGTAVGGLEFTFRGEAKSAFRRNRIGFCVLHPAAFAGAPYTAEHVDGTASQNVFPTDISPHQPAFDLRAVRHAAGPGAEITLRLEGDTFEMEDQRNWTDASYKTYCTPLAEPFPVTLRSGERVEQKVTLTLSGTLPKGATETALSVTVGTQNSVPLPCLGLATNDVKLGLEQLGRLKALHLSHLRVDLDLEEDYGPTLEPAAKLASALGVGLEVALHTGSNPRTELSAIAEHIHLLKTPVARLLVFGKGAKSTPGTLLNQARTALESLSAPIGGGTDAFFTELNREPPPAEGLEFVTYSLNPQVHAFDDASLVETLPVQGTTVDGARKLAAGKPVAVGPVTLKMRWNPNATVPLPKDEARRAQEDPRQRELFNAIWTLGSLKYLAEHGAASVTYFETVGLLGVMDEDGVFLVYYVFADVGAFAGGVVLPSRSSHPRSVESFVLTEGGRIRILLANYTPQPVEVAVTGVDGTFSCRILDEANVQGTTQDSEAFRAQTGVTLELPGPVVLPPRAYACLDAR